MPVIQIEAIEIKKNIYIYMAWPLIKWLSLITFMIYYVSNVMPHAKNTIIYKRQSRKPEVGYNSL